MPVTVSGLTELRKALRKFQPEAAKEVNRSLKSAMAVFVRRARGFVKSEPPSGLSNWANPPQYGPFRMGQRRPFPQYQGMVIRSGIVSKISPSKPNRSGFRSLARVENRSAAGAIYETAGRKNPSGDPRSRSKNPNAGKWFINHLPNLSSNTNVKLRGRLIFKSYEQDQGRTLGAVIKAVQNATKIFNINGGTKERY